MTRENWKRLLSYQRNGTPRWLSLTSEERRHYSLVACQISPKYPAWWLASHTEQFVDILRTYAESDDQ